MMGSSLQATGPLPARLHLLDVLGAQAIQQAKAMLTQQFTGEPVADEAGQTETHARDPLTRSGEGGRPMFRWEVTVADIYKVEFTTLTEDEIQEHARDVEEEHQSRLGLFLHEKEHVLDIKSLPEQEEPMSMQSREVIDPLGALPNTDRVDLRTGLAVLTATIERLQHRLTTLTWSIGLGFALVLALLLSLGYR
jgi:hypothetical protein